MPQSIDFMSRVFPEPNTGCWLWAGGLTRGHGQLRPQNHDGFQYAHRYSYFIHNGDFDRTKLICHKCDVPSCVNPDHLYVGTHQDNHRDMLERSNPKYATGNKIWKTKLNTEKVTDIRKLYSTGIYSMRKLGRLYGVSHGCISDIIYRKRWAYVP